MAFNDKSFIVNIDDMDSFKLDINNDLTFGHCPLIHNSSTVGGIDERFGVLIIFFEDFDVVLGTLLVVDRRRLDDAVVLAPPIAVLTAATVDEEFVNGR